MYPTNDKVSPRPTGIISLESNSHPRNGMHYIFTMSKLDFCRFYAMVFMNIASKQIGLPRTFADARSANRKGVRYVVCSQSGGAARIGVL